MARFALAFALEAVGQPQGVLEAFGATEAALRAQGIEDAAQEVGLEVDRLSGNVERAGQRLRWFEAAGITNLAQVTRRYFPQLREVAAAPDPLAGQTLRPRLEVLGELRFGLPGSTDLVRGCKRRELLTALLGGRLRGRPEVSRLDLMATLYPQGGEDQAAALKELVHQTRVALGTGVIQTTASGHALGNVDSDAENFLLTGETALSRGPYRMDEAAGSDGLIAETLHTALSAQAHAKVIHQPTAAARVGRRLCQANPYDLTALALTLQASGNHRSLTRFYHSARRELMDVGEVPPEDWKTFLERQVDA
ncbi:hypothetical protein [Deinococcus hopiensis]|uniref:hypothetical protein n=1 Tax=Deinococcus hopiensis TaxID=309885 RepID=UPI000A04F135|nr:hypothetical protein [Deinococcus hopiensis]